MTKPLFDKQELAMQIGTASEKHSSFELNQSCPPSRKSKQNKRLKCFLQQYIKFSGDEVNSCCYSGPCHDIVIPDPEKNTITDQDLPKSCNSSRPVSNLSFNASWSSFPGVSSSTAEWSNFNMKSSNKAILTVDAKTSEILTVNKEACILFEYSSDNLIHLNLNKLFKKCLKKDGQKQAVMQDICEEQGNITVYSGKVMEIVTKNKIEMPVSVWMKKIENNDGKKLLVVILQPVSRITGTFNFNSEGVILSCNDDFSRIHGYPSKSSVEGFNLSKLMPSYNIPLFGSRLSKEIRKQHTVSTTTDGHKIPVSVYIKSQDNNEQSGKFFAAVVWFFTNISGPITTNDKGVILNVNSNFSLALLGYTSDQLKNKHISQLLPNLDEETCNKQCINLSNLTEETADITKFSHEENDLSSNSLGDASSDAPSSYINISLPDSSSNSTPPRISTIGHINSLLLGKMKPVVGTSNRSPTTKSDRCDYAIDQREIDDSWVEISLNNHVENVQEESEHLRKINLLLNGSADILEGESEIPKITRKDTPSSTFVTPKTKTRIQKLVDEKYEDKENADLHTSNCVQVSKLLPSTKKQSPIDAGSLDLRTITSTPLGQEKKSATNNLIYDEGHFEGHALHRDGSLIAVCYEIRYVQSCKLFCIWISLDYNDQSCNSSLQSTLYSSFNSTLPSLNASTKSGFGDYSLGSFIKQASQKPSDSDDSIFTPQEGDDEWLAIQGQFGQVYDIKRAVGSGAFGFVRIAKHKKTNQKFIVKFIRKEKVLDECWVSDYETDSMIPLEIALLTKFDHPNVVKVVEFFENEDFFSMVMPTHGSNGIDLFEFIDREPLLNELIASYIFRQIASAVFFLHQEGVVHRDIKDENVIINETFTCKLIDFGSAAFIKKGKTFATFCGTVEYCSPEVLMGERYEGPELEVWALGVTLYTLVYGENPFRNVDETIDGHLNPPHFLSSGLMSLMQKMLQPVPEHRCSILYVIENPWVNLPVDISEYVWDDIVPPAVPISNQNASSFALNMPATCDLSVNSISSSRETLAEHLRKWNKDKKNLQDDEFSEFHIKNRFPLTKRLENINLNHSI